VTPRIRALGVMATLRERAIEDISREMSGLQAEMASLQEERDDMRRRLAEDIRTDSIEGSFYVARYTRMIHDRISQTERRMEAIRPKLEALEERMLDEFIDKKTIEAVSARLAISERRRRDRLESAQAEEDHLLRLARTAS
jgi:uncharacterized coiled-coil protein SlyX